MLLDFGLLNLLAVGDQVDPRKSTTEPMHGAIAENLHIRSSIDTSAVMSISARVLDGTVVSPLRLDVILLLLPVSLESDH